MTKGILVVLLLAGLCLNSSCSRTGSSPPVKVIVPFDPGGGSDTLARVLVREIKEQNPEGPPWVIVNLSGAGGTIGSRRVKAAKPDGNTLLFLHDGILTARFAGQALYGPEAFTPVAVTGKLSMVICVAENSPYGTFRELVERASQSPEEITFSANIGAPSYFMARLVEKRHGAARFRYVQSGGGARRFSDLTGGHVAVSAFSVSEFLNFREGGLRALTILAEERHPSLPDVPTAAEEGLDISYSNLQAWWAPLNTPAEVVADLEAVLSKALESPGLQSYLAEQCIDPLFLNGDALELAMEEKAGELRTLDLSFSRNYLPNLEWGLVGIFLLGGLLSLPWQREPPELRADRGPLASHSGRQSLFQVMLILLYLTALSLPMSGFTLASILYIAIATILATRRENLRTTLSTAVVVPLVLYLFLSLLLGIDFP